MGKNECSLSRLPRGDHHFFLRPQASTDLLLKYHYRFELRMRIREKRAPTDALTTVDFVCTHLAAPICGYAPLVPMFAPQFRSLLLRVIL